MEWSAVYARRVEGLTESEIRTALTAALAPDLISLAGGIPAAELFPASEFREAFDRALRDAPRAFLQYGATEGYGPLRGFIAGMENVEASRILVTNGAQQGLDLVGRLLLDPGALVIVEDPTYLGALETFRQYGAEFVAVPADDEGIRVDAVERVLRQRRARLLYTMPNFANPSGRTMSAARRAALVELSHRWSLPTLEDDAYGELRYDGDPLPHLSTLDTEGSVIKLGTFSKVLSPGLRVGWVRAAPDVIRKLVHLKERSDLHSATGAQMATFDVASDGFLATHVKTLIETYRERRDAMVSALAEFCPADVAWNRPEGGFFVWCTVPMDARRLLAEVDGVVFVPGGEFHATEPKPNTVRLNFSGVEPERIREGVRRVGEALR
jgi:2-aminoadipate transaminase